MPFVLSLSDRARAEETLRKRREERQAIKFWDWLPEVTPKFNWTWAHFGPIFAALRDIASGKTKRLMIFLPPRSGKSECVTVRFPAWLIERNPSFRCIVAAYNVSLASKFSRKTQRIVSGRGIELDREAIDDWTTREEGGVRAVGVGSGVTGHGANGIFIDDPIKSKEEAYSVVYRDKAWEWYKDDLYTRLEPNGFICLCLTRWHYDDLAGRILKADVNKEWTVVKLPALAEEDDPIGRKEGEALCPERFDRDDLLSIKAVMGSDFESLYQQNPTAVQGSIFKREWWKYYQTRPEFTRVIQSWDTAFKDKHTNDPSNCQTWGVTNNGYYLIDRWQDRVTFPDLKRVAIQQYDKWKPDVVIVEDKASGQSLIQEIQRETKIPMLAIKADRDKISRANAVTPLMESGHVFLPEGVSWVSEYVDQMALFPAAKHDEDPDVTSQALNYLSHGTKFFGDCRFEDDPEEVKPEIFIPEPTPIIIKKKKMKPMNPNRKKKPLTPSVAKRKNRNEN